MNDDRELSYRSQRRQDWYAGALRQILELPKPTDSRCCECCDHVCDQTDARSIWKAILIAQQAIDAVELGNIPERWVDLHFPAPPA